MLEFFVFWKKPHISKIYEALTAIADSRVEVDGDNKAKCFSSSKGKYYEVEYNQKTNSIMSNDNTAFYTESVSYPMIAYLMLTNRISYDKNLLTTFKGIYWKDINQKYKNDYDKAIDYVLNDLKSKGVDIDKIRSSIESIYTETCKLQLAFLGNKRQPPIGY